MIKNTRAAKVKKQYKTASNFEARSRLFKKYSTNKYNWYKWIFDNSSFPANSKILELGCGLGALWSKNKRRINKHWDITLSDFSRAMLTKTKENLRELKHKINFKVINIEKIPYKDESFDVAIANGLLYLVPDLKKSIKEIARIIKPGGILLASTSGSKYMKELQNLLKKSKLPVHTNYSSYQFSLENGKKLLSPYFSKIKLIRHTNSLLVTKAKPLTDYILSSNQQLSDEQKDLVRTFFDDYFKKNKKLLSRMDNGLFIAIK